MAADADSGKAHEASLRSGTRIDRDRPNGADAVALGSQVALGPQELQHHVLCR